MKKGIVGAILPPHAGDSIEYFPATVVLVHTSPNAVDVTFPGAVSTTPMLSYFASYTPTVGDVVWVIRKGSVAHVLGKLA